MYCFGNCLNGKGLMSCLYLWMMAQKASPDLQSEDMLVMWRLYTASSSLAHSCRASRPRARAVAGILLTAAVSNLYTYLY